ncbi:NADPH-dependent FMN reductase [Pseudofrancisella aestuarii]|uniref:NADPH-dependent FMN reductase n=1 Tax=Pseudofrancisella aestuarii TaxID=2670347 RepID=A0ABV9TEJ1_9GAMM|nr:NAD(P)H-dependent oxidoreductase [Pseudofrancisella aestuarii]
MKSLLSFGASNSKQSINKEFAKYVSDLIPNTKNTFLDLNDFEMPIYSIDKEIKDGIPSLAYQFKELIKNTDALVISLAEHNGSYSAAFKNIFDWISRIKDGSLWHDKPILLLSTSPGLRGGKTVITTAETTFRIMSKGQVTSFSLPEFYKNFDVNKGVTDPLLKKELYKCIEDFTKILKNNKDIE